MQNFPILAAVLATLSGCLGIVLLYTVWRRRGAQPLFSWAGWILIAAAGWGWSQARGAEYGITIAALIVMLWALALIALRGDWPSAAPRRPSRTGNAEAPAEPGRWWRGTLRFLAAALLPAISGVVAGLVFFVLSDIEEGSRLVAAAFVSLAVWTFATVWCCADRKLLRPSAAIALASCAGGLLLAMH